MTQKNGLMIVAVAVASILLPPLPAQARYRDGPNVYQYVRSSPVCLVDSIGLQSQPSDSATQPTCICGPDVTDWFVEELKVHAKFFKYYTGGGLVELLVYSRYASRISYKYMHFKAEGCPQNGACKDTVTLSGHCIHKSDLGNIMFGAMGQVWEIREPLLIEGGNMAGKRSKTGGIDSPEDMASVIAGLQVGFFIRSNDLTREAFAKEITRAKENLISALTGKFDEKLGKWIKGADPNPLAATGKPYAQCKPCDKAVPADKAHSDFSFFKNGKDVMRAMDEWWNVYKGCKSDIIDNTNVPFPKE